MATGKNNRKWVVRAIISFVAILALLTFFSNTIMNATIPKVIGQNAVRGNLSSTNSSTGIITADLKTDVKSIAGREIDRVMVSNYSSVEAGETLLTLKPLEEGEDQALETLRDQLVEAQRAQRDYEMSPSPDNSFTSEQAMIDTAQDTLDEANETLDAARNRDSIIADAESTIDTYSSQIVSLEATVNAEAAIIAGYEDQISGIDLDINNAQLQIDNLVNLGVPTPTPVPESSETLPDGEGSAETTNAQTDRIAELQAEIADLESQRDELESLKSDAEERQAEASSALASAQLEIADAQAAITAAEQLPSVSDAQTAVNRAQSSLSSAQTALSNAQANANVTAAQTADAVSDRLELIEELEDKIAKAEEAANATEIVAPISGTVYSIAVADGGKMEEDTVIMVIIPPESTYSVTFTFETDVASGMDNGDELEPNDTYIDHCTIMNIRPDENNPRDYRKVKCAISSNDYYAIWPGMKLTVTAGKSNADYDHVIPCSAVGEDNSGSFVYMIIESSGPLGDKYVVRRVSVTVDRTDGTLCAITGEGLDQGMIVTRSEKPLHNGDRVRLEDYSSASK